MPTAARCFVAKDCRMWDPVTAINRTSIYTAHINEADADDEFTTRSADGRSRASTTCTSFLQMNAQKFTRPTHVHYMNGFLDLSEDGIMNCNAFSANTREQSRQTRPQAASNPSSEATADTERTTASQQRDFCQTLQESVSRNACTGYCVKD